MKSVKISELKAKISQYIREVCQGTELIITDRKRPVAKLTAIQDGDSLTIRPATIPVSRLLEEAPPLSQKATTESVSVLLEDRKKR